MRHDIQTASGRYFNFLRPDLCRIDVEEIAHSLSNLCRFTGHVREFYSVAQHAVLASHLVPAEHAFAALHHDDAESIVGDMSSPLKSLLPAYKAIERRVEAVIFRALGLPAELPPEVKLADRRMRATEKRDLMPADAPDAFSIEVVGFIGSPAQGARYVDDPSSLVVRCVDPRGAWGDLQDVEPAPVPISPWTPRVAWQQFMDRHYELLGQQRLQGSTT